MMKVFCAGILLSAAGAIVPAAAQDASGQDFDRFMVRGGFAYVHWDEDAAIKVGGELIPGGTVRTSNNTGIEVDFSYFLTRDLSVAVALGVPPTTTLEGAGTLEGVGELGRVTYGPGVVSLLYHVNGLGPVKPYLGGGINYTIIFDTDDALLQDFEADDAIGNVLQAGVDIAVNERFGIYLDAKKVFASSNTRWMLPTPDGLAPRHGKGAA